MKRSNTVFGDFGKALIAISEANCKFDGNQTIAQFGRLLSSSRLIIS